MNAFFSKENSSAEPLLSPRKSKMSSSYESNSKPPAAPRGPLQKIFSPLSAVLSCQAPTADIDMFVSTSTCSTVPSPLSTPNPSPHQARKELGTPSLHHRYAIAEEMVRRTGAGGGGGGGGYHTPNRGRKDPAYRQHNIISPTSIALNRRATSLPSASSPPRLSNLFEMQCDDADAPTATGRHTIADDGDRVIKQTRSEGMGSPYDFHYKNKQERALEDFGMERKKMVSLKPSRLKHSGPHRTRARARARTSTDPGTPSPARESRLSPNLTKKKSIPIDVDALSGPSSLMVLVPRDLEEARTSKKTTAFYFDTMKQRDDASVSHRSAPELGELSRERMDTERLLSQMGMNVTEEDYCIEGEYASRQRERDRMNTSIGSYDCNYNHMLENAYEDFGVERELVVLKQPPEEEGGVCSKRKRMIPVRSMKKLVNIRGSLGNNTGNANNIDSEGRGVVHPTKSSNNNKVLMKTKVLSFLRINRKSTKIKVPDHIVATITPNSSDDHDDVELVECESPMTPDDLRLLYKWQTARIRSANGVGAVGAPSSLGGRRKAEDMLSITSSCGDKTAPMDNRNRKKGYHRPGFSF